MLAIEHQTLGTARGWSFLLGIRKNYPDVGMAITSSSYSTDQANRIFAMPIHVVGSVNSKSKSKSKLESSWTFSRVNMVGVGYNSSYAASSTAEVSIG